MLTHIQDPLPCLTLYDRVQELQPDSLGQPLIRNSEEDRQSERHGPGTQAAALLCAPMQPAALSNCLQKEWPAVQLLQ